MPNAVVNGQQLPIEGTVPELRHCQLVGKKIPVAHKLDAADEGAAELFCCK
jgi:hypothetical protein